MSGGVEIGEGGEAGVELVEFCSDELPFDGEGFD